MAFTPLAVKDATSSTQNLASYQDANSYNIPIHSADSSVPHYRAATDAFAAVATPTGIVQIAGSASKTIRIKRVEISGAATAAGTMPIVLSVRTGAGTIGSAVLSSALTAVPMDSGSAAGTATVKTVGTANYTTLPTLTGKVGAGRVCMTALGSGVGVTPLVFEFGKGGQALVLRGTTQQLWIECSGAAIPSGGVLDIAVEWAEDAS